MTTRRWCIIMEWYYCNNCIVLCDSGILPYDHSVPPVNIVRSILIIACCLMTFVFCLMTTSFRMLTLYVPLCLLLDGMCINIPYCSLSFLCWTMHACVYILGASYHHAYCGLSIINIKYVLHHCSIRSFFLACLAAFYPACLHSIFATCVMTK